MKDLQKMEMIGGGLIHIDRPETIHRYNECLARLGLEPTSLTEFHIDGLGWSPEIAEEMGDARYLSQGIANPRGIIVTINQDNHPIYMPAHSFDRVMMRAYFAKNRQKIADLTTQTGIALEIDQNMTWYRTLDQVESVRAVRIVSHAGELAEKAAHQQRLVGTFMNPETDRWMDPDLRGGIITDIKENGRLFDRHLVIEDFIFDSFDDYYTEALGGVYVFRELGRPTLTVVEDKKLLKSLKGERRSRVVALSDTDIVDKICDAHVAGIDLDWYRDNIDVLRKRLRLLGLFIVSSCEKSLAVNKLTSSQIAGYLAKKCTADVVRVYEEFELCISHIMNGESIDDFSNETRALLLHPVRVHSRYEENLVWRLICQVQPWPIDVMRLYAVDKNLFIHLYQSWSKSMREVAQQLIQDYNSELTYSERT